MHLSNNFSPEAEMGEMSEINVTPFIDVMLVLLIIFMVVVPIATATIPLNLPTVNDEVKSTPEEPIVLSLNEHNELYLGSTAVQLSELEQVLDYRTQANKEAVVFLRVDKTVPYEQVMLVMNALRDAAYLKIGLVGKTEAN
ncbi:biopolymer transporter ExbD [Oligella urethralis]|nr:biopolymer transporter ExbD [Oligella urethralis]